MLCCTVPFRIQQREIESEPWEILFDPVPYMWQRKWTNKIWTGKGFHIPQIWRCTVSRFKEVYGRSNNINLFRKACKASETKSFFRRKVWLSREARLYGIAFIWSLFHWAEKQQSLEKWFQWLPKTGKWLS